MKLKTLFVAFCLLMNLAASSAFGLPAFARKENVPCALCHANGSAPHLTKTGYLYRRAGFRFPANIGNKEADEKALVMQHFSAGVNVDYELVTEEATDEDKSTMTSNQFNMPGVDIFPLVGGFLGNYGAFSEVDASIDGFSLAIADLRYVQGSSEQFFSIRTGYINPEGYGAGDQWIDDGNLPLIDVLTPQYNQDTLVTPYGAFGVSQLGAELGASHKDSHLTFGVYNGFDGSNGLDKKTQSSLSPALMNSSNKKSKDFRLQLDQFVGNFAEITLAYYRGLVSLLDPSNTVMWGNNFDSSRIYATVTPFKNTLDLLLGQSFTTSHWVNSNSSDIAGSFKSQGSFFGANYYAMDRLTFTGRADYFQYATKDFPASARGYALMANFSQDNNLYVLHYNVTNSDLTGVTNDFRLSWRLFF